MSPWILFVYILLQVMVLPIYASNCAVSPPLHGSLGNCAASLPGGTSCLVACEFGFWISSDQPTMTTCSAGGLLTSQQCSSCPVGTTPTMVDTSVLMKLVDTDSTGHAGLGQSISLSSDGTTMAVGGSSDDGDKGAVFVFTRTGNAWSQQGSKLVGTGAAGFSSHQGSAVSLSGDGNTLVSGGFSDQDGSGISNHLVGAVWVFTRTAGVWTQEGSKLVGTGYVGFPVQQGSAVALSADGNTLASGGPIDNTYIGAVWIFTRSGGVWTQEGVKLVGNDAVGPSSQGTAVALSADGNTLASGGTGDNYQGAVWVFTRSGGVWTQQGTKLVCTGSVGSASLGGAVALSADGNTLAVGGTNDDTCCDQGGRGAVWVFTRSGSVWSQQGSKLVGSGSTRYAFQGNVVSLSSDGNLLAVGAWQDNYMEGASFIYSRTNGVWSQQGPKLIGPDAVNVPISSHQGIAIALSGDGKIFAIGGNGDDDFRGAVWVNTDILRTTCVSCSAGVYCPAGSLVSIDCPVGSFCPANSTSPVQCPAGSYCDQPLMSIPTECGSSFYCPLGSTYPISCPAGSTCPDSGMSAPLPCPAGKYCPQYAQPQTCPQDGYFCPGGVDAGILCMPGTWQSLPGSSICNVCRDGTSNANYGSSTQADCLFCSPGTFSHTNASSCAVCPVGTFSSTGAAYCVPCAAGTYTDTPSSVVCELCPANTFSTTVGATNVTQCHACPASAPFSVAGSSSSQQCTPPVCNDGLYTAFGRPACSSSCRPGHWCQQGQLNPCAAGTANQQMGASSETACIECPVGTFSNDDASSICQQCVAGSYADQPGSTFCQPCPANTYLPNVGATNASDCIPCPVTAPLAPAGSTSVLQCIVSPCPDGLWTVPGGAACAADCVPGSYCLVGQKLPCPAGTASTVTGASSAAICTPCTAGRFSSSPGESVCGFCPIGFWQESIGSTTCLPCPGGSYNDKTGLTSPLQCTPCPASTPRSPLGSTSVLQCTQPLCQDGVYSPAGRPDRECLEVCEFGFTCVLGLRSPCPIGSYTDTMGSVTCTPCGAGWHGTAPGSTSVNDCVKCPLSSWSSSPVSSSCTPCGAGNTTAKIGSKSPTDCFPMPLCTLRGDLLSRGDIAIDEADVLCPLGSAMPIPVASLLPQFGIGMLSDLQKQYHSRLSTKLNLSSEVSGQVGSASIVYTPFSNGTSLRVAALGSDSALQAYAADGPLESASAQFADSRASLSLQTTLPPATTLAVLVVLLVLAILPLALYRQIPAHAALRLDRFSWELLPPQLGKPPIRQPTQFGSACSITFVMLAVLLGIFLGTAPNTQSNVSLLPPSAVPAAGLATTSFEVTLRMFMDSSRLAQDCVQKDGDASQSPLVSSQIGFSEWLRIRVQPDTHTGSCVVAADCLECKLNGASSILNFTLPGTSQLIEWEVWLTGATPLSSSRRYGVLTQQPGQLLDSQGALTFALIESFFTDATASPSVEGSGYEMNFVSYDVLRSQMVSEYSSSSRVGLSILLTRSDVVLNSFISPRQSPVQLFASILSAVLSLFAIFGIVYALVVQKIMPFMKGVPGTVVDQRQSGQGMFIAEDCPNEGVTDMKKLEVDGGESNAVEGQMHTKTRDGNDGMQTREWASRQEADRLPGVITDGTSPPVLASMPLDSPSGVASLDGTEQSARSARPSRRERLTDND